MVDETCIVNWQDIHNDGAIRVVVRAGSRQGLQHSVDHCVCKRYICRGMCTTAYVTEAATNAVNRVALVSLPDG